MSCLKVILTSQTTQYDSGGCRSIDYSLQVQFASDMYFEFGIAFAVGIADIAVVCHALRSHFLLVYVSGSVIVYREVRPIAGRNIASGAMEYLLRLLPLLVVDISLIVFAMPLPLVGSYGDEVLGSELKLSANGFRERIMAAKPIIREFDPLPRAT